MVKVNKVEEMGAYVTLMEYGPDRDGMILSSELSRRRIRSMNKVIREGKTEVVVVLRVDKDKGYIDLSKRRVTEDDIAQCEAKFEKSGKVHSMLSRVANETKRELIKLYEQIGWPLYREHGHAYDAFMLFVNGQDVFGKYNIEADVLASLTRIIKRRMTPRPQTIRSIVEVTCFGFEGIDAIKEALMAGQGVGAKDEVKIRLLAPPTYLITTVNVSLPAGVAVIEKAVAITREVLQKKEGNIVVKVAPHVMSDQDERKLKDDMNAKARENEQVAGDDPTDD